MKVELAILFLVPILAFGQEHSHFQRPVLRMDYYLNLYSEVDGSFSPTPKVLSFTKKLDQKKSSFRKDKDFLEYIFTQTHKRFLKHYTDYATFGETLNKQRYNCLTATALYALLLDHFGIEHQIIETNYHIFLLAETDQGMILIETTDPAYGFVSDAKEIERRINQYRQNSLQNEKPSKTYYRYNFDLYNEVSLDEIRGLLHYNLSILAFNQQKLPLSIDELTKATELYQSPRIEEFSRIILLSVIEGKMEAAEKESYLKRIRSIRNKQFAVTASANQR